ncbi:uncharacterized protein BCR38DRAFT_497138 [Pseudomassariella vexata]|uniref:Fucose-specific lectin n=1 Tax=Pseudomassariella vexata TaxID=1141098 RepID=A0A1Y2DNX4_9PEZI|nr:uncharacterized protein BCR38DRAFT_497138 [Pseudomassariella vexata]ORY60983.1 hypothetical protein BCR38DRAFT_497138 [Pseudomassariella vexata]
MSSAQLYSTLERTQFALGKPLPAACFIAGPQTYRKRPRLHTIRPNFQTPGNETNYLTSKLAATTIELEGYIYRYVVFQDLSNAPIVRKWNSQDNTTIRDKVNAQLFTSWNYFDGSIAVWNGSQLAVAYNWRKEHDVTGNFVMAYQGIDGDIYVAVVVGGIDWTTPAQVIDRRSVVSNTSLALVSQLNPTRTWISDLAQQNTGSIPLANYTNGTCVQNRTVNHEIPFLSPITQFAIASWDNWTSYLYLALFSNGTIMGHFDRAGAQRSQTGILSSMGLSSGPSTTFSAIATTPDAVFYGISADQILEYSSDIAEPSILKYVGVVYPE